MNDPLRAARVRPKARPSGVWKGFLNGFSGTFSKAFLAGFSNDRSSSWSRRSSRPGGSLLLAACIAGVVVAADAMASGIELSQSDRATLDRAWKLSLTKEKGPYTVNYCVCQDNKKKPVQAPDGSIVRPCGNSPKFCAGFREPWAEELGAQRMWIANLFSRDLWLWDKFPDHHDLVRGYILEKYFVETHPDHKLATMRHYGGISGAEYESRDAPRFFERYLAMPEFNEARYYLLAYELQRRFYVREDQGQIGKVRNMATAIQQLNFGFKPVRDQVHNQLSASVIPKIQRWAERSAKTDEQRKLAAELVVEIRKLTSLDQAALAVQLAEIEDATVAFQLQALVDSVGDDPIRAIGRLADVMSIARRTVELKKVSPADRRRLVDIAITASAVINRIGNDLLASSRPLTAGQGLEVLTSLANAAYGSGLLMERERKEVVASLEALRAKGSASQQQVEQGLVTAERVIEWSQLGAHYAFEEVSAPWLYLVPDSNLLTDDILRGSVLIVYGNVFEMLREWATGASRPQHEIFGQKVEEGEVRALNPGLALGSLVVAPNRGDYTRNDIVALPETPAELEPAAGIFTRGEGNVVSHVQLLARALGIPNVVLGPSAYQRFEPHDGEKVFFIVTPGGRVIVKDASAMTERDEALVADFTGNAVRDEEAAFGGNAKKLHIDKDRIDLEMKLSIDLEQMRRSDSGIRGGPKAAYLGELRYLFPDKVARGIVVPFGAYYDHYRHAKVTVPKALAGQKIAVAGSPLPAFVEQTYATFFGEMMPQGIDEQGLRKWIEPRLEIMRASIEAAPISKELEQSIRSHLVSQGLMKPNDPTQTVGVFIRSDTNVEDLDDFNGAGLNLTLFDRRALADVFSGLKQVWASPFSYRSFAWRQSIIDEPLWVLPSVVILESIRTEKSGVLVTTDVERGDDRSMLIATSEGVGGAVDGSPAETLVVSPQGIELVTMFKSPWRRLIQPAGGSAIVASTGSEYVLDATEIEDLVRTAKIIQQKISAAKDAEGRPRPWDIEFGFAKGKLWLFQVRPFLGNESMQNTPALRAYEPKTKHTNRTLSFSEPLR